MEVLQGRARFNCTEEGGLCFLFSIALAAVAALNIQFNNEAGTLSAISLANVEALADGEKDDDNGNCQRNCKMKINYLCITTNGDRHGYICAD